MASRIKRYGLKTAALLLCCLAILVAGCKGKIKEGKVEVQRPVIKDVKVSEVKGSSVEDYHETSGSVKAQNVAVISSRMMGEVTALNVKEGDFVKTGQTILTIDDRDIAEKIKAAEAGYREALKGLEAAKQNRSLIDITYQRYKRLHDEKALSQQELDQIETQKKVADIEYERAQEIVNRAKAGLSEAKVYHGYTRVTSPITGVVVEKRVDKGNMAVPGAPLLTVEDTSSYRIDVNVDERFSGIIKRGMTVDVMIDSIGLQTKAKVSEVVPAIDPMSRTFLVKINLKASGLRSGLYAKVRIPVGGRETILIPAKAVVEKGQLTGVYTVDDKGIISFRPVRTGKNYGENIEVLSGLNQGEKVVTEGIERVIDGGMIQ
ncbi:MAG: efflux RND transporter periplasmic adaptor subunit [Thermodesulfovibrionales bacterium]